jgi:hypothetical protein
MKIGIQIIAEQGMPKAKEAKPDTRETRLEKLHKKVEYAADCIEYDHKKAEAIVFLQELYRKLQMHRILRDDTQHLMQKVYGIIRDYGTLPIVSKESEDE